MSADQWFSIYSDDDGESQLILDRGRKADVFKAFDETEFAPSQTRVSELDRNDEYAQTIESMNGEEWLRQNSCPVCHRMEQS